MRWPEPAIPRLIHQTWKGRDKSKPLPGWVQSSVDSWKRTNPGFVHKMHNDADIEERVRTLHPELLPAYEQMKPIQRADLFRYMVLYDEGGYYADCDVDCTQPVDRWVEQYEPRSFYNVRFIAGAEIVTNAKAVRNHWVRPTHPLARLLVSHRCRLSVWRRSSRASSSSCNGRWALRHGTRSSAAC